MSRTLSLGGSLYTGLMVLHREIQKQALERERSSNFPSEQVRPYYQKIQGIKEVRRLQDKEAQYDSQLIRTNAKSRPRCRAVVAPRFQLIHQKFNQQKS